LVQPIAKKFLVEHYGRKNSKYEKEIYLHRQSVGVIRPEEWFHQRKEVLF
jgi:hypothetical protein